MSQFELSRIPTRRLRNSYDDAIQRTEPACAHFLSQNKWMVNQQPKETHSAKMSVLKEKGYVSPDLTVFSQPNVVAVEVKAHKEFIPRTFYDTPEGIVLKNKIDSLCGKTRFVFAQKENFMQGLDEKDFQNYLAWQKKNLTIPVIIAFNDVDLHTWNRGEGIWYGTPLYTFQTNYTSFTAFRGQYREKKQRFVLINDMKPLNIIVKDFQGAGYLKKYFSVIDLGKKSKKSKEKTPK